jgi:hypothetical protein
MITRKAGIIDDDDDDDVSKDTSTADIKLHKLLSLAVKRNFKIFFYR